MTRPFAITSRLDAARRTRGVRRVVLLARLMLFVLAAATLFGFAGALWWVFDLFSHFRAQYVIAALLLALILVVLKARRWALLAVALIVINVAPIVTVFLQPTAAASRAPASSLRVLLFNVFGFNRQYARMLDYVEHERPDVLVLLEVNPEWMPSVRQLAADYPHQWINVGNDVTGIAVMSRMAPRQAQTLVLGQSGAPSYLLTFESAAGPISVLGTHLSWPIGAHTSRVRNSQLLALARLARQHPVPLAIVGDLNTTPFSPNFQRLLRDGGLRHCGPDAGLTPTWPAQFPPLLIQIDHCLATASVQAWNFRVGDYLGSDHYPISVEVAPLPATPPGDSLSGP